MQLFLSARRVRLLEDLVLLTASLGDKDKGGAAGAAATTAAGPLSSVAEYKRELALALQHTTGAAAAAAATSSPPPATGGVVLSGDGCATAEALRAAAGVSTEEFFGEWAERFGTLLIPLGGDADEEAAGGGGGRKDDR